MPASKDVQPLDIGSDYLRLKLGKGEAQIRSNIDPFLTDPEVAKRIGNLSPAVQKFVVQCAQFPPHGTRQEFRDMFLREAQMGGVMDELGTTVYRRLYSKLHLSIQSVRDYIAFATEGRSFRGGVTSLRRRSGKHSG